MKTIFISVSGAILIRNFFAFPGALFNLLKKQGLKIVLFVPKDAVEEIRKDFGNENVFIEPAFDEKKTVFQNAVFFISKYLIFEKGARVHARAGIRSGAITPFKTKILYPIKLLIANTLGKSLWIKNYLMLKLDRLAFRDNPYKAVFGKYKPDIVFLPNIHSDQDVPILREAKMRKIKTIGMPGSWDHFPKKYMHLKTDRVMVWNESVKKEAVELQAYKEQNVSVVGVPQYDIFAEKELLMSRSEFCGKFGFDENKKIILFTSEADYSPDDADIIDMILKFIKEKKLSDDAQIFIRPYPAEEDEHKKFDRFENEKLIYIDWIEPQKLFGDYWYPNFDSMVHFMNILYHSDIVINTYSSISVEASAFLKPIININFDGYKPQPFYNSVKRNELLDHWKPVFETKGAKSVNSEEELLDALNNFFHNPNLNRENVEKLRDRTCWKIDGKSSERIAGKILDYLSN